MAVEAACANKRARVIDPEFDAARFALFLPHRLNVDGSHGNRAREQMLRCQSSIDRLRESGRLIRRRFQSVEFAEISFHEHLVLLRKVAPFLGTLETAITRWNPVLNPEVWIRSGKPVDRLMTEKTVNVHSSAITLR